VADDSLRAVVVDKTERRCSQPERAAQAMVGEIGHRADRHEALAVGLRGGADGAADRRDADLKAGTTNQTLHAGFLERHLLWAVGGGREVVALVHTCSFVSVTVPACSICRC